MFNPSTGACEEKAVCNSDEELDASTNSCMQKESNYTIRPLDCSEHGTLREDVLPQDVRDVQSLDNDSDSEHGADDIHLFEHM